MPLKLTTPYSPGDNSPGNSYPDAQIVNVHVNLVQAAIVVTVEFGTENVDPTTGAKTWAPGYGSINKVVTINGADFAAMVAALSQSGEAVYAGVKRLLYQYLLDKGVVSGTLA